MCLGTYLRACLGRIWRFRRRRRRKMTACLPLMSCYRRLHISWKAVPGAQGRPQQQQQQQQQGPIAALSLE
jgi:hypothetical protein